ncbi:MAG: FtsX-like permease family protein, partial [Prevotella sp.]|nr:FtsX-like permease family protein [Prevotella sp.]
MIQHIFKIIWSERKTNAWLLAELIIVFCILWFCSDYLCFMVNRYFEPKGFDIEHTYRISLATKDDWEKAEGESINDHLWTIYDRVKSHPEVEQASFAAFARPYGGLTGNNYLVDSVEQHVYDKMVTPEFFEVFNIKMLSGKIFDRNDAISGNYAVISAGADNMFAQKPPSEVEYIDLKKTRHKVTGVAERSKKNEYEEYVHIAYVPLQKDGDFMSWSELCFRVKPGADKNFAERFKQDMQAQLEVGPYYLADVIPIGKDRIEAIERAGYENNFKSIYAISAFLIVNIFLGVIGSFWFRMQSRRSEIGLRMAMGASKRGVKSMFATETIILLFIASIIATIICINISLADILKDIGIPVIDRETIKTGISIYFINYTITFIALMSIAVFAVWYPARRASNIQPAIALRD